MNGIVILGCGASFRSGFATHFLRRSPSFDFDNLAHMWLMPINTTARGQTPGDRGGLLFSDHRLTAQREAGPVAPPARLSNQTCQTRKPKKTNTTSIYQQHPAGSAKALIVFT